MDTVLGRWSKTILTFCVIISVVTGVGWILTTGQAHFFRPGPLIFAHRVVGDRCTSCHEPFGGISEKKCQTCHLGSLHQEEQAFNPPCVGCHSEHRDRVTLTQVTNARCIQCHGDLQLRNGESSVKAVRNLTDFTFDHPEFAVSVLDHGTVRRRRVDELGIRSVDPTELKFSHDKHLSPKLKSPKGVVQLSCQSCHTASEENGKRMIPVTFAKHCSQCHTLGYAPGLTVPHASPETVRGQVILQEVENPNPVSSRAVSGTLRITRPLPLPDQDLKISARVTEVERHLYTVTCVQCHTVDRTAKPFVKILPVNIPAIWMPSAEFSHKAHRALDCTTTCHTRVPESQSSAEILLPRIETCKTCHRADGSSLLPLQNHAPTGCVTCHVYHDKKKERAWKGALAVHNFTTTTLLQSTD